MPILGDAVVIYSLRKKYFQSQTERLRQSILMIQTVIGIYCKVIRLVKRLIQSIA